MSEYILEMKDISKSFPGVKALKKVNLAVKRGEIHCLMGENGAGKSTLIKILAGALEKDEGEIFFDGKLVEIDKPEHALNIGISFIYQELSVVENLTVEGNVTLGSEYSRYGFIDNKENTKKVRQILKELDIKIHPNELVKYLSVSQRQMMLIAKAFSYDAKLIVMDEPTASLTDKETSVLYQLIKELKSKGVSFLFISHRFEDIYAIGDSITVFRDGEDVGRADLCDIKESEIIKQMVGRNIEDTFPKRTVLLGEEMMRAENIYAKNLIKDVSFSIKKGQILGVAGLAGAGKTELAKALFGENLITQGALYYHGKRINITSPRTAMRAGIALLPEERRSEGIVGKMSVRENISLASSEKISWKGIVNRKKDKEMAQRSIRDFGIKTPTPEQHISLLSGGNQQKTIVAKWINSEARIILLDEPTRGIDIGAKSEIYEIMKEMAINGKAIMMFSSELPELIGMCDEIIVMKDGKIRGILSREEADQEKIMQYAMGGE